MGEFSNEKILPFNANSLQTVMKCIKERRTIKSASKFTAIIDEFPKILGLNHGYHLQCYKRFTAIKCSSEGTCETETTTNETGESLSHSIEKDIIHDKTLRSSNTTIPSLRGTGVLRKACIFL